MDIRKVFGANARKFRLALGLSREAVAERMGVDRAFISSMERGLKPCAEDNWATAELSRNLKQNLLAPGWSPGFERIVFGR